ncbi:hypothetical protein F4604DRAFT_1932794 [Suillus subluteus]|nr:hypothetical protein F4604DRAFT_1932794 [Suillus subluteus]
MPDGPRFPCHSHTFEEVCTKIQRSRRRLGPSDAFVVSSWASRTPNQCALIRRLKSDENIPLMPWALYESTLGIHTSYMDEYHPYEIIPVSRIVCPLALIPAYSNIVGKKLWIAVSFDHAGTEPEDFDGDDLDFE